MKKIIEYKIVEKKFFPSDVSNGDRVNTVEKEINRLIKDGWQPLGGMQPYYYENYDPYKERTLVSTRGFQTLVKYSDSEEI